MVCTVLKYINLIILKINQTCTAIFTIAKSAPEYDEDVRSENDFGIVSDEEDEEDEENEEDI